MFDKDAIVRGLLCLGLTAVTIDNMRLRVKVNEIIEKHNLVVDKYNSEMRYVAHLFTQKDVELDALDHLALPNIRIKEVN